MKIPTIGLTIDAEGPGRYSSLPWYAIRQNYCNSVDRAGGLPLLLPHNGQHVSSFLDKIDGLVITGGNFDINPLLFGATSRHDTVKLKEDRTNFELALTREALNRNIPILGICGGQQLIHVAFGGSLVQHIPDEIKNPLAHEQPNPRTEPGHIVHVNRGTLLHRIVGLDELEVNSAHHQAAKDIPEGLVVNAIASDGVIEGIEAPNYGFCLGVQWHPEYDINKGDSRIFSALISACLA